MPPSVTVSSGLESRVGEAIEFCHLANLNSQFLFNYSPLRMSRCSFILNLSPIKASLCSIASILFIEKLIWVGAELGNIGY